MPRPRLTLPGAAERIDLHRHFATKPYAPGARVGLRHFARTDFHDQIQRIKGNHDFGTANLPQLSACARNRPLRQARRCCAKKLRSARRVMKALARGTFSGERGRSGNPAADFISGRDCRREFYTAERENQKFFFQAALKADSVLYVPGELCYADDPSRAKPNQRTAHQLRQRERGKHPQRNCAAGQGVEEIFVACLVVRCRGYFAPRL